MDVNHRTLILKTPRGGCPVSLIPHILGLNLMRPSYYFKFILDSLRISFILISNENLNLLDEKEKGKEKEKI